MPLCAASATGVADPITALSANFTISDVLSSRAGEVSVLHTASLLRFMILVDFYRKFLIIHRVPTS